MSKTLTRQMQDYFAYVDETQGAVDLAEVREPRTGVGPVRPIRPTSPPPKHPRRGWLVAAAASAAVVVVVGGLAFWFAGEDSSPPVGDTVPPTTDTVPTTLAEVPEAVVESGTLNTPLGTAGWIYLSGDEFTLPAPGPLEVTADGELIVSDLPSGYWFSEDGIDWRLEGFQSGFGLGNPDEPDQMTRHFDDARGVGVVVPWVPYADGSYARVWIIGTDPIRISNSEGDSWIEEDLSDLVLPASDGFDWDVTISRPVTRYVNPDGVPGTQSVLHARFTGPYTGQNQCHVADERLLILDHAGNVASIEVPWEVLCDEPHLVNLFGTSDSVYAYVGDWSTGQVSVWQSSDGHEWTSEGSLHDQLGAHSSSELQVTVLPALQDPESATPIRNQLVVVRAIGESRQHSWESTDGVSWTPAPAGLPEDSHLTRLESGWFGSDGQGWWMHDGDNWVSLEDIGLNSDYCNVTPRASGQTTVFFATNPCTPGTASDALPNHMWIVTLDP